MTTVYNRYKKDGTVERVKLQGADGPKPLADVNGIYLTREMAIAMRQKYEAAIANGDDVIEFYGWYVDLEMTKHVLDEFQAYAN